MKFENQSMGMGSFFWFVGVVEDRKDPLKTGRLKVRSLGYHTEDLTFIPTDDLFWAELYQGTTWSAGMNGIGFSPNGPIEGTWVWGSWKDGESMQEPVVHGVLNGIPQGPSTPGIGFSDQGSPYHDLQNSPKRINYRYYPNDGTGAQLQEESSAGTYPRNLPWSNAIGESDVNRLARGENTDDTIIGVRNRQRDVNVPIAPSTPSPNRKWTEPKSTYAAQYPYNYVFEDESGSLMEFDATPGAERIHIFHRSGTFIEIQGGTDGDFVLKCVGKRYEVTMENFYSHFQNTMNVTVDGETNVYCRSNCNLQVDGNLNVSVGGDVNEKVKGNYYTDIQGDRVTKIAGSDTLSVGGDHTMKAGGNEIQSASGSIQQTSGGDFNQSSGGSLEQSASGSIQHSAGGSFQQAAGGSMVQSAGGHFSMTGSSLSADASSIDLNSGMSSSASPQSPQSPQSPDSPSVPNFPSALNKWVENANDTGSDPAAEQK